MNAPPRSAPVAPAAPSPQARPDSLADRFASLTWLALQGFGGALAIAGAHASICRGCSPPVPCSARSA